MACKPNESSAEIQNRQLRKIIRSLIDAGAELNNAANDSLNLDLAVGNVDFPDVQALGQALDHYDSMAASAERLLRYLKP